MRLHARGPPPAPSSFASRGPPQRSTPSLPSWSSICRTTSPQVHLLRPPRAARRRRSNIAGPQELAMAAKHEALTPPVTRAPIWIDPVAIARSRAVPRRIRAIAPASSLAWTAMDDAPTCVDPSGSPASNARNGSSAAGHACVDLPIVRPSTRKAAP